MAQVVPLEDSLFVEIEPNFVPHERTPAGGQVAGVNAERAVARLNDIGDQVAEVCSKVYARAVEKLEDAKPHELVLEFGLTLGGEAGVPFVTKGTAEATFTVTATWKLQ